jgi:hypothetical protein
MENLLKKLVPVADRPYSQNELKETRLKNLNKLSIGEVMVYHPKCNHFYLAKSGGKKELAVLSNEDLDDSCCSVCWKLRKTEDHLRDPVYDIVDAYQTRFEKKPEKWSLSLLHLELTYYKLLYLDFNRNRQFKRHNNRYDNNRYDNNRHDNNRHDNNRHDNNRHDNSQ